MEYKEEKTKQIDVVAIAKTMWQHKKAYIIALPVVAVVSFLLIVCVPRTYTSTVKLAPELSSFNSSSLSDIASSFGFDMGTSKGGGDALFPELYPDLIQSNDFITANTIEANNMIRFSTVTIIKLECYTWTIRCV